MADIPQNILDEMDAAIAEAQDGRPRRFIEDYLWIRDENERLSRLKYNAIQSDYDQAQTNRDIKNKPRKIGFSTQSMAEMYALAVCIPHFQGLALTYDGEETAYLFRIVKLFQDNFPDNVRPKVRSETTTSIAFANDSYIEVQTAGGGRKGRGRTPSYVLVDEFAQYDDVQQEEIWSSVVNSVPLMARLRVQSTPNGIGNKFHSEFVRSVDGQGTWKAFFYPWMWLPEKHSLPVNSQFALVSDRGQLNYTEDEFNLIQRWNQEHTDKPIGEGNIRWRRMKIDQDREKFRQEFPEDPVSCFLATSETVFPTEELNKLLSRVRQATETRMSAGVKIWRRPEPGQHYVVGVDCASGVVNRDYSAAVIGTSAGRVDAVVALHQGQVEFAQLVYQMSQEYNQAFIINERQNAFEFQRVLLNELGYRNIYHHHDTAGFKPETEWPVGFPTTGGATGNKMRLIETMRRALRSDGFDCQDIETLRELVEYKQHKNGTYGAPSGSHDDRAMAAMLYLVGCQMQPVARGVARSQPRAAVQYPVEVWG